MPSLRSIAEIYIRENMPAAGIATSYLRTQADSVSPGYLLAASRPDDPSSSDLIASSRGYLSQWMA